MDDSKVLLYTAFAGQEILASGRLEEVALKVRKRLKSQASASVLIFSDSTGKQMDLDLRGSESEVLDRLKVFIPSNQATTTSTGPGRPKLGVVSREVSLLPRHWEWLSTQNGGASATLRRLVEEARRQSTGKERIKEAQERTHQVMSALVGDFPHYEEALRALYAKDKKRFNSLTGEWPSDIRDYTRTLSRDVWE